MMKTINKLLILLIISVYCNGQLLRSSDEVTLKNTCIPRQVRLLIGEDYSNYNITEIKNSATIIFQTYGECLQSSISVIVQNSQVVTYDGNIFSEIVHSQWNGEKFCHHNKLCTNMYYDQYVHIFRLPLPFGVPFTYTVYGNLYSKAETKGPFNSQLPLVKLENNESPNEKPQRILFFGDQDNTPDGKLNMNRWRQLKKEGLRNKQEKIDFMLFLGDYAYEFYMFNGKRGDHYLDSLEEFVTEWPTAMQAGNHEDNYNFKFYNEKFRMPSFNETSNNYYSFNQGLAHFIGVNLHFYDSWATPEEKSKMVQWVEQDLIRATQNRNQTPWIIAFGHKPIYCSGDSDCQGFPQSFQEFDELFYQYSVDLYLGAHVHRYQFLKPLYDNCIQSYEGDDKNIFNPQGMISVIQGNGGHVLEFLEDLKYDLQFLGKTDERVFEIKNYVGYGILEIYNSTTLCLQNIRSLLNKVESTHCIHSKHYFDNTKINRTKSNENIKVNSIFQYLFFTILAISSIIAFYFAYKFLLKYINQ
ncbi:hypothetical protein ABPG72_008043 [Tetrahymena utriculariae]